VRMLLKWELGLRAANAAIRTGKMAAINDWLQLESTVEFIPVMNADDLQRGLTNLTRE
jgi:hypothetical protein